MSMDALELAEMQSEMTAFMPESGTVYRLASTPDDMGGVSNVWSASGTASLRISPALFLPFEGRLAERVAGRSTWYLTFPANTDVTNEDRVYSNDRIFEVVGIYAPKSFEVTRRVVCVEAN